MYKLLEVLCFYGNRCLNPMETSLTIRSTSPTLTLKLVKRLLEQYSSCLLMSLCTTWEPWISLPMWQLKLEWVSICLSLDVFPMYCLDSRSRKEGLEGGGKIPDSCTTPQKRWCYLKDEKCGQYEIASDRSIRIGCSASSRELSGHNIRVEFISHGSRPKSGHFYNQSL